MFIDKIIALPELGKADIIFRKEKQESWPRQNSAYTDRILQLYPCKIESVTKLESSDEELNMRIKTRHGISEW